jgi:hypothetical protein
MSQKFYTIETLFDEQEKSINQRIREFSNKKDLKSYLLYNLSLHIPHCKDEKLKKLIKQNLSLGAAILQAQLGYYIITDVIRGKSYLNRISNDSNDSNDEYTISNEDEKIEDDSFTDSSVYDHLYNLAETPERENDEESEENNDENDESEENNDENDESEENNDENDENDESEENNDENDESEENNDENEESEEESENIGEDTEEISSEKSQEENDSSDSYENYREILLINDDDRKKLEIIKELHISRMKEMKNLD